jgi:acyl-coenzyme A synthetase/AMP-(fatty) acid ligase
MAVRVDPPEESIALIDRIADAVVFRTASGDITAAAFLADVRRCAAAMPPGRHLLNICSSRYWFAVAFAAGLLRGQITLLTSDQSERGLAALAGRFAEALVVTDDPGLRTGLPQALIGRDPSSGLPSAPPSGETPWIDAGRTAIIVFSSGTTGEPIGTAKTFGELAIRSRAAGQRFGFDEAAAPTMVGTVPPNHMYGFETTVLLPLHAAVSSWCDPVFYPADLGAALCTGNSPHVLVTTPLQLRAMLAMQGPARAPNTVISATAPLDPELAAEAEQLWGAQVLEIFGASEVGSIASRRTTEGPEWLLYPGVTLTGEERPLAGLPGAEARRLADVVELLPDGRTFRLIGRCGDLVKRGGRRASLAGLSRALMETEGVSDGVFVAPDDFEARPTARLMALVVSPTLSNDEVLARLRQRIDPVFLPRPLVRVPALPRNSLGKLPRQALLALLAEHAYRGAA